MSAPVFISYPRDHSLGQKWARDIDSYLHAEGIGAWRDVKGILSGQNFCTEIEKGIEQCAVLLLVVSSQTRASQWVQKEIAYALKHDIQVLPVLIEVGVQADGLATITIHAFAGLRQEKPDFEALKTQLQKLSVVPVTAEQAAKLDPLQRQAELVWLSERIHRINHWANHDQLYVPMRADESAVGRLAELGLMQTGLDLSMLETADTPQVGSSHEHFSDILHAFRCLQERRTPRIALLGEAGAGKTFSLQRIALELGKACHDDESKPVPLLIALNDWTREEESLPDYIRRSLGELGCYWTELREQGRAMLLLDAMNELPVGQRADKARQIEEFIGDKRWYGVVVSCRELEFQQSLHLHLNKLCIRPLAPGQIRNYCCAYLGQIQGESCFWRIAGGAVLQEAYQRWMEVGATEQQFWHGEDIPREDPDVFGKISGEQDQVWHAMRVDTRHLMRIASNPFILFMLVKAFEQDGDLPQSRYTLFSVFIRNLYNKAKQQWDKRDDDAPDFSRFSDGLQSLALRLQGLQSGRADEDAQTRLDKTSCDELLGERQLAFALDSHLLVQRDNSIGFQHQLMQECMAAPGLWRAIEQGDMLASELWPVDRWWQANGWEVTIDLLREALEQDDLHRLLLWIAPANPDLASKLSEHWQMQLPSRFLQEQQSSWLPQITDSEVHPHARAAAARALGRWGLDTRTGIGLNDQGLPDIDWVQLPEAEFYYQDEHGPRLAAAFDISRYLVTNAQYQAFIDDGGYQNDQWWRGFAERFVEPEISRFDEPNSPRENVSWYESMAFCRWLSDRTGHQINLPTEHGFERAARGPNWRPVDEKHDYPWRDVMASGRVNFNETLDEIGDLKLGRTSAVGVYPLGRSIEGIEDLAGNVWEWCLNEFIKPDNIANAGGEPRVLRGSSWYLHGHLCRTSLRIFNGSEARNSFTGFRLSCLPSIRDR